MSSTLQYGFGSFTVSYELNGQTYTTKVSNFPLNIYYTNNNNNNYTNSRVILEVSDTTTTTGITYYTTKLGFSDNNFPDTNENGINISIYSSFSNNNYIITGPNTNPSSEFGPSITFNTTNSSLGIPNDFYENINVIISYVFYNNTLYNFTTTGAQKTNPQTVTPSNSNGIYSYTYTLELQSTFALQSTSNSISNTATFSSNAVTAGNTAATVTSSALKLIDPTNTTFTDEEAADIANSVRTSVSHLVSSGENFSYAINKAMKATMN